MNTDSNSIAMPDEATRTDQENGTSNRRFKRPRLRRKQVPQYLREVHGIDVALATLNKMASVGGGPVMLYVGRIPYYDKQDLNAWAESRLGGPVHSTSERARYDHPIN